MKTMLLTRIVSVLMISGITTDSVQAQIDPKGYPQIGKLDDRYSALAEKPDANFIRSWGQRRLAIVEQAKKWIYDYGKTNEFEDLSYDHMLMQYGVSEFVERNWLTKPDLIKNLFDPEDREAREELALQMLFLDKCDVWFSEHFGLLGGSSTSRLDFWAGARARSEGIDCYWLTEPRKITVLFDPGDLVARSEPALQTSFANRSNVRFIQQF